MAKDIKKKKKRKGLKIAGIIVTVLVVLIVLALGAGAFYIGHQVFNDVAADPDSTTMIEYTITADTTKADVEEFLLSKGLVTVDERILKLRELLYDADYVEGTYKLSKSYTTEKIINILCGYNYSSDEDE